MIEKKKDTTIHKDNRIIKDTRLKNLTPSSIKLLDFLYLEVQKHLNKEKKGISLIKTITLNIRQTTLRQSLGLERSEKYTKEIRDSLKTLQETIELKNYTKPNGDFVRWSLSSFVYKVEELEDKELEDKRGVVYKILIDNDLFNIIEHLQNEWTEIDLDNQKHWKSTNTIRLYQYLKSIQNLDFQQVHTVKWFNDFFKVKKPLTEIGRIKSFLDRQITLIEKDTDLKVNLEIEKETKTFKFVMKKRPKKLRKIKDTKQENINDLIEQMTKKK